MSLNEVRRITPEGFRSRPRLEKYATRDEIKNLREGCGVIAGGAHHGGVLVISFAFCVSIFLFVAAAGIVTMKAHRKRFEVCESVHSSNLPLPSVITDRYSISAGSQRV
jgi:hypothetical protein